MKFLNRPEIQSVSGCQKAWCLCFIFLECESLRQDLSALKLPGCADLGLRFDSGRK